jgi:hypothetical protein
MCDKIEEIPTHHNGLLWPNFRPADSGHYYCEEHSRSSIIVFRDYTEDEYIALCKRHGIEYIPLEPLDEINARSTARFILNQNAEACTRGFLDAEMDELYRDREKD